MEVVLCTSFLSKEIVMNAIVHKTSAFGTRHHEDGSQDYKKTALTPSGSMIQLNNAEFLHLRGATGWTVKALEGALWITQDGDLRDIVLEPGESHRLDRRSPALISPMGNARLCLSLKDRRDEAKASRHAMLPASLARLLPSFA